MKKFFAIISTLILSSLGVFGSFAPAQAHSDGVQTVPAAGSTVEAGAIPVELKFNEPLMIMDGMDASNEIIVLDSQGSAVGLGQCTVPKDSTLSATALIDQPGTYTVNWRAVSEDGHPVEGKFDFKVENTTNYVVDENAVKPCAVPMPISAPTAMEDLARTTGQANDSQWPIMAAIGFVAIAVVAGAVVMVRAKRRN